MAAPPLRRAHRASAVVVGSFAVVHLANQAMALAGADAYLGFLRAARLVYRAPVVEAVLLACVAFQLASGLWLVASRPRAPRSAATRLQALAGALLAGFLALHVGAVLAARAVAGLDTGFHFAAAGLHLRPWAWLMAPYYVLGTAALCTHLAQGAAQGQPRHAAAWRWSGLAAGLALSALVVSALAGAWYPVHVPPAYAEAFGAPAR